MNLVCWVYGAEFDDAVAEFAETVAPKPPPAIQAIKRSAAIATRTSLEEGIAYDRQQFEPLLSTEEHREGVRPYVEDDYESTFDGRWLGLQVEFTRVPR
ncbi:enoyl-CoA hydratase/isomerase family protein [Halorubrum trueperi]|uniref:Enoyl-CoA hydratase/isomerase family protein n=1 Tax=Halorubrum trueperi TaxID=2004704 RepID=A0ABD5UH91_9EURY